uniref:Uncharacterized protein n=1 Tax=Anguilla anguilla TaxID=7936 RepID=A0A0E9R4Q3_ANGAN
MICLAVASYFLNFPCLERNNGP